MTVPTLPADELKPNSHFEFALNARAAWLKTTNREQDPLDQILLGSMGILYWVLLCYL